MDRRHFLAGSLALAAKPGCSPLANDEMGGGEVFADQIYSNQPIVLRRHAIDAAYAISRANGNDAMRFEVRAANHVPFDVANGACVERAELSIEFANSPLAYRECFRWSFDLKIPQRVEGGRWCVLAQIHHPMPSRGQRSATNPPLSICWNTEGQDGLSILARTAIGPLSPDQQQYIPPEVIYANSDFPIDRWVRIELVLRFDPYGDACLMVCVAGEGVFDSSGDEYSLGYSWPSYLSPQFGIYRASSSCVGVWRDANPKPMVAFYRNMRLIRLAPPCSGIERFSKTADVIEWRGRGPRQIIDRKIF